jgi:hypothetical protein
LLKVGLHIRPKRITTVFRATSALDVNLGFRHGAAGGAFGDTPYDLFAKTRWEAKHRQSRRRALNFFKHIHRLITLY